MFDKTGENRHIAAPERILWELSMDGSEFDRTKIPYAGSPLASDDAFPHVADKGLARHVIEVVAPPIDLMRLQNLLSEELGATSVKMRNVIVLREAKVFRQTRLSKLGKELVDVLSDKKPWRSKHLIEHVAKGRRRRTVHQELRKLEGQGIIAKARTGVWMLAGLPMPADGEIPPMHSGKPLPNSSLTLLGMLDGPTEASLLRKKLGVSRQRIDQMLKLLLAGKQVVRINAAGMTRRWLWMRSDGNHATALSKHMPSLAPSYSRILNSLEPGAFHSVGNIAEFIGLQTPYVLTYARRLETLGIVNSCKLGQFRFFSITQRGLAHPSRIPTAKRASAADMSKVFCPSHMAFFEAFAVLGKAKTADVTAALNGGKLAGTGVGGQIIARMTKSGMAEKIPGKKGKQPFYRLTEAGKLAAGIVSNGRKLPSRETMKARIEAYRLNRADLLRQSMQKRLFSNHWRSGSPAQNAVLKALESGPLNTEEIMLAVSGKVKNPRSVYLMMKSLVAKGRVEEVESGGRSKVWSLASPSTGT